MFPLTCVDLSSKGRSPGVLRSDALPHILMLAMRERLRVRTFGAKMLAYRISRALLTVRLTWNPSMS